MMKVIVEQEDIDNGTRGSIGYCPVARAIRRLFDNDPVINVYFGHAKINHDRYRFPEIVFQFIRNFDSELTVQPFEFEMKEWRFIDGQSNS